MSLIRDLIHNATRPKNNTNNIGQTAFIGRESFRSSNPYVLGCYDEDKYASIYPSVKAISNEFMKIRPLATDANGKPQQNVSALNALYHPNQLDSSVAFREKLAVMNLTHRNTYLLVWRSEGREAKPGGELFADNIAGFTFLENPGLEIIDGRTYYNMGAQRFSDLEVITIPGGVDPSGLYLGYAPGIASASWATLDEYIADFQKGFFENGAVPAGQFVITAATPQDYNDTVDKLQDAHRGASKNNNVTYTPRPVDPTTGKPGESKIEWIPFQTSNKDIDFKTLFEQANNRIDSTFGVPASIRGVGENNNYATARIDQQNFIRFTIEPLALRIYTQITHELNRITGGLGAAITFEIEYPAVAEEEQVQAETKKTEIETLLLLTDRGFSLDTIVDALKYSPGYKTLQIGDLKTTIENDKPDVDNGDEVNDSPDPNKIDGITPLNEAVNTRPKVEESSSNQELQSSKPKAELSDEEKLEAIARRFMQRQIDRVIAENAEDAEASNEVIPAPEDSEVNTAANDAYKVILSILSVQGAIDYIEALAAGSAAGLATADLSPYFVSEALQSSYQGYLKQIFTSYGNDTADSIRKVLANAEANPLTRKELEANLRNILNTDDYRAVRIARTEINHSTSIAKVDAFQQMADLTGSDWEKTIDHTRIAPCPLCASQEGIWHPIDQPVWDYGATIDVTNDDGSVTTYVNNFISNPGFDYHVNGRGTPIFRRVQ